MNRRPVLNRRPVFTRRQLLGQLGVGAVGLALRPRTLLASEPPISARLDDLARRIRDTSRAGIADLVVDAISHGAQPQDLLGATFLAGVEDVHPRPVGGRLHSVMTIEASYRLVEMADDPEAAWLLALWSLESFKDTQHEPDDPWVLPSAPTPRFASEGAARRELVAGLEAWDAERVDRAIVGLLPFHSRASLYEVLWPWTARCMAYLGHKVVYGAMTEAVLRRLDWRYAEPVVRSLVYALVGPGRDRPVIRAWEHAATQVDRFPAGWLEQRGGQPGESVAILRGLLDGDYRQAQQTVVEALRSGLSTRVVWDAIRLGASELWLRRRSNDPQSGAAIRAAHAVTEVWSLGHAWRATEDERNKRWLLLQAAAWIPEFRDGLEDRRAISLEGPGVLELGGPVGAEGDPPETPETKIQDLGVWLEAADPSTARVLLDRRPELAASFRSQLRRHLDAKGLEYHQLKVAVALEDEVAATHPRWRSYLQAPTVGYLPTSGDDDNELTGRFRHLLGRAGIVPGARRVR